MALVVPRCPPPPTSRDDQVYQIHPRLFDMLYARNQTRTIRKLWIEEKSGRPYIHNRTDYKDDLRKLLPNIPSNARMGASEHRRYEISTPPQQKNRSHSALLKRRTQEARDRGLLPVNYYTAVSLRAPPAPKTPKYDALNRPWVPIPSLLDANPTNAKAYTKRDIGDWRRQVVKSVPERQPCTIPANRNSTGTKPDFHIDYKRTPDPNFRQVLQAPPTRDREYVISAEWYSEKGKGNYAKPGHGPMIW